MTSGGKNVRIYNGKLKLIGEGPEVVMTPLPGLYKYEILGDDNKVAQSRIFDVTVERINSKQFIDGSLTVDMFRE